MPELWRVYLTSVDVERVEPQHLHAAMCRLLDRDHHATVKDWAVAPLASGGRISLIEVRTLSAEARAALLAGARIGVRVVLGGEEGLIAERPRAVASEPWAVLARGSAASRGRVGFRTPAAFRAAARFSPLPAPSALLRSASSRWEALAPGGAVLPRLGHPEVAKVWVEDVAGETWIARIPHNKAPGRPPLLVPGFVGAVTMRCDDPRVARVVDSLLRFAVYAGAGAYTTHGMGVVTVESLGEGRGRSGRDAPPPSDTAPVGATEGR
jgi:hypothetical protein